MAALSGWKGNVVLALAAFAASIAVVEAVGRIVDFDFDRQLLGLERTPIFYTQATVPIEPVFFRRSGPAKWTGQVLYTGALRKLGEEGAAVYRDEEPITVRYDDEGFRNPPDLDDWEVAVAGDSFTELGYLKQEDLFTSVAGRILGARFKNLGISGTGLDSYTAFVEHFGIGPSTTDVVAVFFEGNDLESLPLNAASLEEFERTGERPYREIRNQSSFVRALLDIRKRRRKTERSYLRAELDFGGERVPTTVRYAPPSSEQLGESQAELLDRAIARWAATARAGGVRPWVAYMPSKIRVLYEHLSFTERAKEEVRSWRPNDLPEHVGALARRHGAGFIDLTPALRRASAAGQLTYNPIWDTHLTAAGSRVVGEALAEVFAGVLDGDAPAPPRPVAAQAASDR